MDVQALARRARLQRISVRGADIDRLREMLTGDYHPFAGDFTPAFEPGTSRYQAFERAARTTTTTVPVIVNKSLAGLDFGNITWSDAERQKDAVDAALNDLELHKFGRELATELRMTGAAVAMAHTPVDEAGRVLDPVIKVMRGVNIPYVDPRDPDRITGWYRAVQYVDDRTGRLRWWVEAYDWEGRDDGEPITHRVWESLASPTELATSPTHEFESIARPRFVISGLTIDGLPASPLLANMGRILGLYSTELRLAASEELAAFPMLLTKGDADVEAVGPAETIAVGDTGDARWLEPGDLNQLREQVRLKRDLLREAFNLPGGALGTGGQTPSGEALQEANRGFIQETRAIADGLDKVITEVTHDYLRLRELPEVDVQVPIDRSYTTDALLEVVEKGVDLGGIPSSVVARMFQQFLGSHYSDKELQAFLEEQAARRSYLTTRPGELQDRDRDNSEDEDDAA